MVRTTLSDVCLDYVQPLICSFGELDLHEFLNRLDLVQFNQRSKKEKVPPTKNAFKRDNDPFGFGFSAGKSSFFQSNQGYTQGNFHQQKMFNNPSSLKFMMHHHRVNSMKGDFTAPNLSKFTRFHEDEIIMAKHQVRLNALGDQCAPQCPPENSTCTCLKLFECVKAMSEYGERYLYIFIPLHYKPSCAH